MQTNPNPSFLNLGNEAIKNCDYLRAIEHYNKAIAQQPEMLNLISRSIAYAKIKIQKQSKSNVQISLAEETKLVPDADVVSSIKTTLSVDTGVAALSIPTGQPSPAHIFNKDWYLKTYKYPTDPTIDWLQYYHTTGWKKGEDPSPIFSTSAYLEAEAGLTEYFLATNQSPLSHYCAAGYREKRNLFHNPLISFQQRYDTTCPVVKFAKASTIKTCENSAAFIHCYYIDIADRIIEECIGRDLKIHAAFIEGTEYKSLIEKYGDCISYKIFPNRGRDISPFVTGFTEEIKQYEFALHLHTKKSLHYGTARSDWMEYCLEALLGNVSKVEDIFRNHKNAAIVFPEPPDFLKEQMNWGHNYHRTKALMSFLNCELEITDRLDFPAGSMFWFRTKDLMPIFELSISPFLFEEENGQVDGTLAHAYERLFGMYAIKQNKKIIPIRQSTTKHFDFSDKKIPNSPTLEVTPKTQEQYNLSLRHFYPELTPFSFRASYNTEVRLNLLVPTIDPAHIFGGISTALDFYRSLVSACNIEARIITTDGASSPLFLKNFPRHSCFSLRYCSDDDPLQIVSGVPRSDGDLQIRPNDIFIATSWWSANHLKQISDFQNSAFNINNNHIYLVQDYEPHFYGWSSKSQLADETYNNDWIKVYNTNLLKDYFTDRMKEHGQSIVLKPQLNNSIQQELLKLDGTPKEKIILVYGRPFAERNCNEILLEAISIWQSTDPESQNWKLISLGQQYEHVLVDELGINVLGKVSLEEYANLLAKSSIGISLMVSPHPSYPPFEMLASGLKTYTNTYDNKLEICDSENLHMGSGSPNDIANFLLLATNKVPYDSVYRTASMEQADFGAGLLMSEAVAKVKDIILTT
ncbi:TPA: rhamnan synthesis F family protein [Pseudomonas putida]|uniref:rhamnosyltransferase WsaF family glycosyltransferase n=2 Tax=Bacteria TaxID=2 RepID=UPI000E0CFEFA|nr:rhamnan synthesis F family protein [Pseudomonas putida]MBS5846927.1 hypothetical protein [Pseudomonas putida]MCE0975371.1 hypothetical protein [Pseudomonas putida]WQE55539.1 rhamnan synthesis F family protein [Pseudomonas putida]GLO04313.1 hypothetical protein PPUJ13061_42140 [Pseudomonas putida]HDS1006896.1 hypothetical protein [Pseudomonas putida]